METDTNLRLRVMVCMLHFKAAGGLQAVSEMEINLASGSCLDSLAHLYGLERKTLDNKETKEEDDMASLSTRTTPKDTPSVSSHTTNKQSVNKTEVNNMNNRKIRTVNATLNDNDTNLSLADTLVFQKTLVRTEHTDDKTIQNLLMSGKVQAALEKHNEKRQETVDKAILKSTGVKVFLDPVAIWDLQWEIVTVA